MCMSENRSHFCQRQQKLKNDSANQLLLGGLLMTWFSFLSRNTGLSVVT